MRAKLGRTVVTIVVLSTMLVGTRVSGASAAANPFPEQLVAGFETYGFGAVFVYANGTVEPHGDAGFVGDASSISLAAPITGGANGPNGCTCQGYVLVATDGGVFTFGQAHFWGSMGGRHLNQPMVSMAATLLERGYWLAASDGGVFRFGDAPFLGSLANKHLNQPIVGIAATASFRPTPNGYRMVARDGGIFDFGDAHFYGSLAARGFRDVIGMAPTPNGGGYWIVRSSGSVYNFGNALKLGGVVASAFNPVVAMIVNPYGQGYVLVRRDGTYTAFGAAPF